MLEKRVALKKRIQKLAWSLQDTDVRSSADTCEIGGWNGRSQYADGDGIN